MKTIFTLAVLAVGAYAAPAADTKSSLEQRNHPVGRYVVDCTGTGDNETCWHHYTPPSRPSRPPPPNVVETCHTNCSSTLDMINCLTAAGPDRSADGPRFEAWGFPYLGPTNTTKLNNASLTCFKDSVCPRLDQYMTCFQCGVDKTSYGNDSKAIWVKNLNKSVPGIDSLCEAVGATTSNYTMVVFNFNGAMQAGRVRPSSRLGL